MHRVISDRLLIPRYHGTDNTGSDACLVLANHWLKTCSSSHQNCERPRPSSLTNWKPTRLIHIKDANPDFTLRLCESNDIPVGVKYATLSHCWGIILEAHRIVLRKENLNSWKREIPDLKPLKTFYQAVIISRNLGLEYIWIDSLCIIQDSEDDWSHEASLMSSVYKYSRCTITATAANDDTVGCFFDRDPDIWLPNRLEIGTDRMNLSSSIEHPVAESVFKRQQKVLQGLYDLYHKDVPRDPIESAATSKRAWIVQEVCKF